MSNKSKPNLSSTSSIEHLPDLVSQTSDCSTVPRPSEHDLSTTIDDIRKMTCSSPMRQQQHTNLTVLDVYDEAALIGKDFERIIEAYGTETIRDLVPKVIRILELLELQAAKNERETDELLEMRNRIERLELEKSETRELREKFDRELEMIEEQWRKEAENLMSLVAKLEDENRRLRDELQRHSELNNVSDLPSPTETISITREELQCIKNLTEENLKLKRLLKVKEKECTQKTLDLEGVQAQLERMCKLNCTLRQRNTFSTNQTQRLMVEKFDLEVQLKEKENIIYQMKDRVGDDLLSPTSTNNPLNDFALLEANQPRFTLEELRQVLWERNDLKTKLLEVEEELRLFKEQEENNHAHHQTDDDDENGGAVEGPIPLEPEEKLYGYKRDESKVRQLFSAISLKPASDILRSLFPLSAKKGPTVEEKSPFEPMTPVSSIHLQSSYSTFSSPSVSKRLSIESLFHSARKSSKGPIPLLSPPASE